MPGVTISMTNLSLGCNPVGHKLVTRFLASVTQLSLDILFAKQNDEWVSGKGQSVNQTGCAMLPCAVKVVLIVQEMLENIQSHCR